MAEAAKLDVSVLSRPPVRDAEGIALRSYELKIQLPFPRLAKSA